MPKIKIDTLTGKEDFWTAYKPYTQWSIPRKKFVKLHKRYSFNLQKMIKEVDAIVSQYELKAYPREGSKKLHSYRGINLTSRKDSKEPLYDGLKLYSSKGNISSENAFYKMSHKLKNDKKRVFPAISEDEFKQKTVIYNKYIEKVLNKFNTPITKARIISLKSGGLLPPHVDFPYYKYIRIHASLKTNPLSFWEVEGEKFHVPADGYFYWLDSGRYHSVWNDGDTDRLNLSINLKVYNEKFNENNDIISLMENGLV